MPVAVVVLLAIELPRAFLQILGFSEGRIVKVKDESAKDKEKEKEEGRRSSQTKGQDQTKRSTWWEAGSLAFVLHVRLL